MKARVTKPGPLQNPATAVAAWARFRRLMRWMFLITLTTVIGAISVLYRQEGMVSVHFYIAVALGMALAMLLMAGLMGLVFVSAAAGMDDGGIDGAAAEQPADPEDPINPAP